MTARWGRGLIIAAIALILAFIWGNSLLSRGASSMASGTLQSGINRPFGLDMPEGLLRKLAHIGEFAALGTAVAGLLAIDKKFRPAERFSGWAAGLMAAVTDESLQLLSGRSAEVRDVLIDFSGYTAGFFICIFICGYMAKRRLNAKQRL